MSGETIVPLATLQSKAEHAGSHEISSLILLVDLQKQSPVFVEGMPVLVLMPETLKQLVVTDCRSSFRLREPKPCYSRG
jgi:hypothetical protein